MASRGARTVKGGDAHAKDAHGMTALHRAAGLGDQSAVRKLLDRGADPSILDTRMGASPLHHAAQSGSVEATALLLNAGAFVNLQVPRNGITPLMTAVWHRKPSLVAFLLRRPEINVELRSVFGATAAELIGFGTDDDDEAAHEQNDALRDQFLAYRQRREDQLTSQPLFVALTDSDTDQHEKAIRIRQLLEAAAASEVDTTSPLLSSGNDGHTPLLVAARDGNEDAVAALLAAGADQTAVDEYMGAVAAHKAAYGGHADVLRLLAGATGFASVIDAQGPYNGYTPLHDAVWHGHLAAATVLVSAGARTDLAGLDGKTPADLALEHGYQELIDLFAADQG